MADSPATRTRKPSARSLIAVTGAAAMAVTLAHATATQATPSSTVSSDAQVATGNYYPTPLTTSVTCTTNPDGSNLTARRAEVSWDAVPNATGYRLELINRNTGDVWDTHDVDAGTTTVGGIRAGFGSLFNRDEYELYAQVRTVNGPSVSSGFTVSNIGMSYKDHVSGRTECEGPSGTNQPNQPWENTHQWDPNTVAPAGNQVGVTGHRSARTANGDAWAEETGEPTETTTSTNTDTSPRTSAATTSESTTERTTSPGTSTSSPSTPSTSSPTPSPGTSTTPGTSTPPNTTETRQVKPQLTRKTTAPSGTVTAGMTADGRVALVDGNGIQLVDGQVEPSVELQWQSEVDILWIVGPEQTHRIMKSVDGTWKFYLDSGQNLPAGIG